MKKSSRRNVRPGHSNKRTARVRSQVLEKSRRGMATGQSPTFDVTYEIVQHDGGSAYRVNGVFSEAYPTHAEALAAAHSAVAPSNWLHVNTRA